MRDFYGRVGRRYSRQLLLIQTLFFALVLAASTLWALDRLIAVPGAPWTTHIPIWLAILVLAVWVVTLSHALPPGQFSSPRQTKRFVGLLAAGAIGTGFLVLVIPDGGSMPMNILVVMPVVLATMAACAISFLYVGRMLTKIRRVERRYESAEAKIDELRTRCGADAVERIELSHALELGHVPGNPLPGPAGYVIAGLPAKPWYDSSEFPWTRILEQSFEDIRAELENVIATAQQFTPYGSLTKEGWDVFRFVSRYCVEEERFRQFPKTAEVLKSVPHYPLFRDAMYSVLVPGGKIPPHRDGANVYLTCHLALRIPDNCGIRVGGEARNWEEGKCIVFDSSYEHEAWNSSDEDRYVFLVDFLRPELTDAEVDWVASKEAALFAQGA